MSYSCCRNVIIMLLTCHQHVIEITFLNRWFQTDSLLNPDSERCVGITANLLNRAGNSDHIVHELRYDKNDPIVCDWRILYGGGGPESLGRSEYLEWLPKKTANFLHEFFWQHFLSKPQNDFPHLPDDRSRIRNLHEKLPMRVIDELLETLVLQRIGAHTGHYHFSKCLHLEHKLYLGKQHIRSQLFPAQKFYGYFLTYTQKCNVIIMSSKCCSYSLKIRFQLTIMSS